MKGRRLIAIVSFVAAIWPVVFVASFVGVLEASPTHWFAVQRITLALLLIAAGVALILNLRFARSIGVVAWALVVADSIWGVIAVWPHPQYMPMATQYFLYIAIGVPVLWLLFGERASGATLRPNNALERT